ncbi:peptidase M23 [Ammoniphilus oxalaticus]|uniref:Peptidase M23 n=1 Tax=Ammoniphilus oxalaticus TaxID=66863 RepID=A0A419SEP1_9BACL|nr:M23 family metallopeptidase [Ammoniphilus oxalaticus]RKD21727.1 peptidase M23 [Ammoniphilus oxalaticus]
MPKLVSFLLIIGLSVSVSWTSGQDISAAQETEQTDPAQQKLDLFHQMEMLTNVPWFYLAAMDQYEKNIRPSQQEDKEKKQLLSIQIPPEEWVGPQNPDAEDTSLASIEFFNGAGMDGDGDGLADPTNDFDLLFTVATRLAQHGFTEDDIRIGIWEHYRSHKAVKLISEFAKVYKTFNTIKLEERAFPLPIHSTYSYRSTWGAARGWGGRRIHEGTDLFAHYGTPVKSVCYGVVEVKGWNRFGGWRIGIRDLNNVYHYYAHLGGFNKDLNIGDVVKPGDVVGWVGSSGYGSPGTSGKFPPHLHYGMYKYNGKTEWAFDPFPSLKRWERQEWDKRRKKK